MNNFRHLLYCFIFILTDPRMYNFMIKSVHTLLNSLKNLIEI